MNKNEEVYHKLSDFLGLYVLIFGAIMVILGVQFIIIGLALSQIEAVCFSIPLILIGGILLGVMLQDKVYHRVFYRPAYPEYYSQPYYQSQPAYPPAPSSSYPPAPSSSHASSPSYPPPPTSSYPPAPPPSYPPSSGYPPAPTRPPPPPILPRTARPPPVPQVPRPPPLPDHPLPPTPSITRPPPLPANEPVSSFDDDWNQEPDEEIPYARELGHTGSGDTIIQENVSHDGYDREDVSHDGYDREDVSHDGYGREDVSHDGYGRENVNHNGYEWGDARSDKDIPYASPVSQGGPAYSYPSASLPAPPAYYPPYYSGYGQAYGTPGYTIPYVTYVQYFRETFSIPQIRSLLIIFLISIVGGSVVLIMGEPVIYLFPIFFIIAFTFPSFIWISYVYHKDILEPESKHGIFIALTWGMFSTLFAIFPNTLSVAYLDIYYPATIALVITAVVVAPINEEFFKPLGLRRVRGEINSELDGLIYGVTCGMGFAIIENFSYELTFLFSEDAPIVVWTIGSFIRGIGSTIVHAVGAGLIGFTYARIKIAKRKHAVDPGSGGSRLYGLPLILAYLMAVGLHAAWNGSASIPELFSTDLGVIASILGHLLVFTASFHIIKSLANEGIRRDAERHRGVQYLNPVEPEDPY